MSPLLVAAAVIFRGDEVLLTQRKPGTHLEGMWEFPGGKVEEDEDPRDALRRELEEELGILVAVGDILEVTYHRYPTRTVLLLFYRARIRDDSPPPKVLDTAAFCWSACSLLDEEKFPAADRVLLRRLKPG